MRDSSPDALRAALDLLATHARSHPPASAPAAFVEACWASVAADHRPAFFRLLDLAAGLPRLGDQPALADLPRDLWPQLTEVVDQITALQVLVDRPIVPPDSTAVDVQRDVAAATRRLEEHHCVTVDFFLDHEQRHQLDDAIDALRPTKDGTWGALPRDEGPEVYAMLEAGLASDGFRRMTGYDPDRDTFSLTLSLQRLDATGIGWHRDLYWPVEWVGEDVFAVFYALDGDHPDKGGAFVYYLPWDDRIHHFYRQRHQATVLWNSADHNGRILHAVSGYHGPDTARHLLILQCLRRR